METFRKFLVTCFGIALAIGLSILVMINGWGLEIKSLGWIIGVGFFWTSFCSNYNSSRNT